MKKTFNFEEIQKILDAANWSPTLDLVENLPPDVKSWLFNDGSTTAKLRREADKSLSLKCLSQELYRPSFSENLLLSPSPEFYRRQVVIYDGNNPCMFAYSIFPEAIFQGPGMTLKTLGDRFLGDVIFADGTLRCKNVSYAKIGEPNAFWARRLVYNWNQVDFIVIESLLR